MSWSANLAAMDQGVSAAMDDVAIQAVAMARPSRGVNTETAADTSRPSFGFLGTFDSDPEIAGIGRSQGASPGEPGSRQVSRTCVTALLAGRALVGGVDLPGGWPWQPRKDDHLVIAERAYRIALVDRDGTDRVAYWLNRVS